MKEDKKSKAKSAAKDKENEDTVKKGKKEEVKEEERKSRKDHKKEKEDDTEKGKKKEERGRVSNLFNYFILFLQSKNEKSSTKGESSAKEEGKTTNPHRRSRSTKSRGQPTMLDDDYLLVLRDIKYPMHKYVAFLDDEADGLNFKIAKVSTFL